ncbi:NAD(P)H-dependent oxidoreductase [Acinetobacter seifertii]|uniref:NAD(P)H-dependent oxidoreductase n=1 Tax=Acinetobacter seifertii TaxID=1530123 RepID=A0A7H2VAE2_9GAMM|nr:NAD(P)H-dependent oxidoreductase [Acinetobacter seifertii]MBZ6535060.1 NAD(P)H-dependent oxidoreductase [Acinetobacter seifertii]QNX73325.1 NAD(P)H-dependent oxidoreductase [Acinetobacter seifertii]
MQNKKLVIVAHPNIKNSKVNKRWIEELNKYPDEIVVHELYSKYSNGEFDIKYEQSMLEKYDTIIFQFPIYWFNCPPLLKKWFDDVFTYGWAYGASGNMLANKKIGFAVSAGSKEIDFSVKGKYSATLENVLLPFKLTTLYVKALYCSYFSFYGAEDEINFTHLESSAVEYIEFIKKI